MLKRSLSLSLAAGVFISIGGSVFLACDNKIVGAVFFSVALLSICFLGCFLYTGKVGYLVVDHGKNALGELALTLLGNFLGTLICGLLIGWTKPAFAEKALGMVEAKLSMSVPAVLVAGFFCGVLMYAAVAIYKEKQNPLGILFCVPVFILSGFEHSIADMFYFFVAGSFTAGSFGFLALVVIGNSLGGVLLPLLRKLGAERA